LCYLRRRCARCRPCGRPAQCPIRKRIIGCRSKRQLVGGGVRYMALCAGMVAIAGTCAQAQLGTIANWGEPIAIQGTPSGTFRQVSGGWDTALGFVSMAPSSTGAHRSSSRPCFSTSMNFENTFRSTTRRIRSSVPGDRRGPFDQFRGSAQRRG
jgi:hypothetical protein